MNAPVRLRRAGATPVALTVNGRAVAAEVEPRTHLADFMREDLNLTGTHLGCEHGVCGACTVLVDGEPARSCLTFAATCEGADVVTIEGFDDDALMAELRAAFNREHALQCGFCTPGMLVTARDLALRLAEPDERRIRVGLAGNLCRCTGYLGIVRAIQQVIADRRARGIGPASGEGRGLGPVGARCATAAPRERAAPIEPIAAPSTSAVAVSDFAPAHTFEQSFVVAFPPERVFALFGDVRAVAECLPGAFVDAMPSPDRAEGGIRVALGPIAVAFRGAAMIARDEAERSGRILGAGADGRSGAQGEIRYRVVDGPDGGSEVRLTVGYALKGPIAQFGRPGLVRDIAGRLVADFARNLEARLAGRAPDAGPGSPGLNPLRLATSLLFGRIASWLARLRARR
ncbi:2Fe-2S iron-sulfur cluster-binding protein [Methylopila henanensis]|uniref:2Fe-2S iron-sulfur cluster-binding protein n=1 Tax=Methylopila henanensis TaxID=873516 RepID=A0ABW4KDQ3_9HYPH